MGKASCLSVCVSKYICRWKVEDFALRGKVNLDYLSLRPDPRDPKRSIGLEYGLIAVLYTDYNKRCRMACNWDCPHYASAELGSLASDDVL